MTNWDLVSKRINKDHMDTTFTHTKSYSHCKLMFLKGNYIILCQISDQFFKRKFILYIDKDGREYIEAIINGETKFHDIPSANLLISIYDIINSKNIDVNLELTLIYEKILKYFK